VRANSSMGTVWSPLAGVDSETSVPLAPSTGNFGRALVVAVDIDHTTHRPSVVIRFRV
jgi:hypothetical protein